MPTTVIPCLRYHDAPAMLDWLCEVFGFARHLVVEDGAGGIAHAQLALGDGMIMLGSARDDAFGRLQKTPRLLGGVSQSAYLVVAEVDALAAKAAARGATILRAPQDEDYGGRGCSLLDPEGVLWSLGSYDPWAPED